MIKAGIIGAAGYTGGELIRLLALHPEAELAFAQSESCSGKKLYSVHHDLFGSTEMEFSAGMDQECDVVFLCKGHGESRKLLAENSFPENIAIIDLSQDFRHYHNNLIHNRQFVYGLPEANRDEIRRSKNIANPGCFATAIELSLLPLAYSDELEGDVHINATTGSTGAGQTLSQSSHFSWRSNNHSVYKALTHQHLQEIKETLEGHTASSCFQLHFIPQRGAFTRGIHAVSQVRTSLSQEEISNLYHDLFNSHPFVHVVPFETDVKQVVNTNKCFIHLQKAEGHLIITTVIDNLIKGAAGQAIQNMNLMFGLDETAGLQLKPTAF